MPPTYHVGAETATPPATESVTAPQGLAVTSSGQLLSINGSPADPSIRSNNRTSGYATVLSDNPTGTGPA
ncbi:MAG: hypothetical protein ACLQVF_09485 [Isosphaeraceae bacterium]